MSWKLDNHCEEEMCFAHSTKNTCKCLDKSYESAQICPFFKTMKEQSDEIKAIKHRLKNL